MEEHIKWIHVTRKEEVIPARKKFLIVFMLTAVSYTHLDVYKRQITLYKLV